MTPGILSALACLAVFMLVHIPMLHLVRLHHRLAAMLKVILLLIPLYVFLYFVFQKHLPEAMQNPSPLNTLDGAVNFANGIFIYLLLFMVYCCAYIVADHALTVAFMISIEDAPNKSLTMAQIKELYPYDLLVTQRLRDLQGNGFLSKDGDYYCLTAKGEFHVKVLGGLKAFLKLLPGG